MKRAIEKIVAYAVWVAEPDKIILFGSTAHGTNDLYSDLDLLIVSDKMPQHKKYISEQVARFAQELSLKADVLVCTKQEIDISFENPTSFLASIVDDGKIVYKK